MVEHEQTEESTTKETSNEKKLWSTSYLKKSLSDKEISAQAIMFLAAGYETTATTLALTAFNLASYEEKQKLLLDEIDSVLNEFVSIFHSNMLFRFNNKKIHSLKRTVT